MASFGTSLKVPPIEPGGQFSDWKDDNAEEEHQKFDAVLGLVGLARPVLLLPQKLQIRKFYKKYHAPVAKTSALSLGIVIIGVYLS